MAEVSNADLYALALQVKATTEHLSNGLTKLRFEMRGLGRDLRLAQQGVSDIHVLLERRDTHLDRIERRLGVRPVGPRAPQ